VRTPAWERLTNHAATLALGLTGAAYAFFAYALHPPKDSFSVVNHPWQPHALHAHVLAAPVGVLAVGLLLRQHVIARLANPGFRRSRRSGILLAALAAPMIVSGYLLQVMTSEGGLLAARITHWVTGAAWILGWLFHLRSARRVPLA
jgi:hypothetical protein